MEWIDEQRAAGELGKASIRHNMNLLSRFFSWAIARGKASINPVRLIPMGSRPTQSVKSDTPWLDDDLGEALLARLESLLPVFGLAAALIDLMLDLLAGHA